MKVTKAELKRRVSEAITIINSPLYRKNPAPWLMHALHKVFYDGYVDEVSGLNSPEWMALQALRDGPIVYFTEGQIRGEVDWFQTTEVMQDATSEQIKDWEKQMIDVAVAMDRRPKVLDVRGHVADEGGIKAAIVAAGEDTRFATKQMIEEIESVQSCESECRYRE